VGGERPLDQVPVFQDEKGEVVLWGEETLENNMRNASAESAWLTVRPEFEAAFQRVAGAYLSPTSFLSSILDLENSVELYRISGVSVFQTFWARFGWAHILLNSKLYWVLVGWTGVGVLGGIVMLRRSVKGKDRSWILALVWLGTAAALIWLSALLRGFFTPLDQSPYIPTARYAFPAMMPTMLLLAAGWRQVFGSRVGILVTILVYFVFDVASILAIVNYYG